MHRGISQKLSYLLGCYFIIVLGYIYSFGFYSFPELMLLTISLVLVLIYPKINFSREILSVDFEFMAKACLIVFLASHFGLYDGFYQNDNLGFITLSKNLLFFTLLISFSYFIKMPKRFVILKNIKFWVFIFIAFFLRILMIWSSPSPLIDVYGIQKLAPKAILEGKNPYSIVYHFPWQKEPLDVYSYGPAVIILDMPAVFLMGDPRYTMVFAEIGTALLFYLMIKKNNKLIFRKWPQIAELLPLIFLFNPRSLFIIPFFIWNSADFFHDVVFLSLVYPPRYDSLSLNSLLFRYTGFNIPSVLVILIGVSTLVYLLRTQKKLALSAAFLATSTLALCIFLV